MVEGMKELEFGAMRLEHIREVMDIERKSFRLPWTANAFLYEMSCNNLAHYVIALENKKVVGYAGMWIVLEEAHITNIAVAPEHRRRGYGKSILVEMMLRALLLKATKMTLEVRVSNLPARRLYAAFGFVERGFRKKYYEDNNEDAIIMWKDNLRIPGLDKAQTTMG